MLESDCIEHSARARMLNGSLDCFNFVDSGQIEDNFMNSSVMLKNVCSRLKNAIIYRRVSPFLARFPDPENLERVPDHQYREEEKDGIVQRAFRPLKYNGEINGQILVSPCQTHRTKKYWLAYGYRQRDRIFLLQEVDNGQAVSFVGQSEPVPKVDEKMSRGQLLDAYFRRVYKGTKRKKKSSTERKF